MGAASLLRRHLRGGEPWPSGWPRRRSVPTNWPIPTAPGIRREEAFAKPGLWAGRSTTEPGVTSGWHHHGDADTVVYVLSGTVVIEFGEERVEASEGEFLVIPGGLVHRESTPPDGPSKSVVIRTGGDGPPTFEVDGPNG